MISVLSPMSPAVGTRSRPRVASIELLSATLSLILLATCAAHGRQKQDSGARRPMSPESPAAEDEGLLPPLESPRGPVNCELAGRYIDDAVRRSLRVKNSKLIVIVRPGAGEPSARLNDLRLKQVKAYTYYIGLTDYVVAVGERSQGGARIELYVGGASLYALPLRKNKGLDMLSCVVP